MTLLLVSSRLSSPSSTTSTGSATIAKPAPLITCTARSSLRTVPGLTGLNALSTIFSIFYNNPHLFFRSNVNANSAFATLVLREGGGDGSFSRVNVNEFDKGTSLAPDDVNLFDGTESSGEGRSEVLVAHCLDNALK